MEACSEHFAQNEHFLIYGDPAYPRSHFIQKPFSTRTLSDEQAEFNRRMSRVRQAVEWGFGIVTSKWPYVDYKKRNKLLMSPVAKTYLCAMILCNFHCCLYENQVSQFFNLEPPSLTNYLSGEYL